jgi:hypothetical protein
MQLHVSNNNILIKNQFQRAPRDVFRYCMQICFWKFPVPEKRGFFDLHKLYDKNYEAVNSPSLPFDLNIQPQNVVNYAI